MMESFILPLLLLLLALPLFLSARKQKRAFQEQQQLQSSIGPGDRVMTTSGLYGTVVETSDDTIDIEIAPGVQTTWLRAAVRERVKEESDEVEETTEGEVVEVVDAKESADAADSTTKATPSSTAEVAPPLEQGKNNR